MFNIGNKKHVFVVYDGVKNSVFQSQVLAPILNDLEIDKNLKILLTCFEKNIAIAQKFAKTLPQHERLEFLFLKRNPFIGSLSIYPAIRSFKPVICKFLPDKITARGPLAGYVVLNAVSSAQDIDIVVQARGLCAQEFRYSVQKKQTKYNFLWNKFIYRSLDKIEHFVYRSDRIKIEAVSLALKAYLINYFGTEHANITISVKDIPKTIDKCQVVAWRSAMRDELNIPDDATVYCYSGSFKPWQCAAQTIECFAFEYSKNSQLIMLILTQDIEPFKKELERFKIPTTNYRILTVKPQELFRYMCVANFGILLREADIINWVSRPTKILEYQACGLRIIHNNTVAWLG